MVNQKQNKRKEKQKLSIAKWEHKGHKVHYNPEPQPPVFSVHSGRKPEGTPASILDHWGIFTKHFSLLRLGKSAPSAGQFCIS